MIKVTVGEQKTQSEKPFPKLMINKRTGAIFYMTKNKVGFYIDGGRRDFENDRFVEGIDMLCFTDYNEPITLQNA